MDLPKGIENLDEIASFFACLLDGSKVQQSSKNIIFENLECLAIFLEKDSVTTQETVHADASLGNRDGFD